jgi:hypothetical protein
MVDMTRWQVHGNGDSTDKAKSPTMGSTVGEHERHDLHKMPSANTTAHASSLSLSWNIRRTLTLAWS